jgi:hypothetical protein
MKREIGRFRVALFMGVSCARIISALINGNYSNYDDCCNGEVIIIRWLSVYLPLIDWLVVAELAY